MNLPNKLTVLRMFMIPIFLIFAMMLQIPHNFLWAAIIFGAASFTDFLDGYLARKNNLVTDFGKFMDPLADKLLVMSAMITFVESGWASAVAVIVIIAREFLVTSIRLIASTHGTVIAADGWGKLKTVFQIIWVLFTLLGQWYMHSFGAQQASVPPEWILWGVVALQYIVLALTVFSGFNYLWKNRALLSDTK